MLQKVCPNCGCSFETSNKTKVYCTSKCRDIFGKRKYTKTDKYKIGNRKACLIRKSNPEKYLHWLATIKKINQRDRDELRDRYIKGYLSYKYDLRASEITPELIEAKREALLARRLHLKVKEVIKNENQNQNNQ